MTIAIGDKLPDGEFFVPEGERFETRSASDVFDGRKVVLIGVPAAFSATCTINHVPSFIKRYEDVMAKGIDEIAVLAVNDPFVLRAWRNSIEDADRLRFLGDPGADYVEKLDLTISAPFFGGTRARRFCLLVEDREVTQMMTEESPGESAHTDAEALLSAMG